MNRNRQVVPDRLVREIDCPLDFFVRRIFEGNVDFALVFHYPKAVGARIKQFDESRGQNVLAGVLLHVVETTFPIDLALELRAVDGTDMAAVIREPPEPPDAKRRVSMRASSDELDVSAIARQRGGGGHRQAAGLSSAESVEEIAAFIRTEFARASKGA